MQRSVSAYVACACALQSLRVEVADIDASVLLALEQLAERSQLTSLTLDGNRFGLAATSALAAALWPLRTLQHLSLSASHLHAAGAERVAAAVGGLPLLSLELRSTRLGPDATRALTRSIARLHRLTALVLGVNFKLCAPEEREAIMCIRAASGLQVLRLGGTTVSDPGARCLHRAILGLSSLRQLDLSFDRRPDSLRLDLGRDSLGLAGKAALEGLQLAETVDNYSQLAQALVGNSQLTALALSRFPLTDTAVGDLQPTLRQNPQLRSLSITPGAWYQACPSTGESELAALFAEGALVQLTVLQLEFLRNPRAFGVLVPHLSGLSLLQTLSLQGELDDGAVAALAATLPALSLLRGLALKEIWPQCTTDACPLLATAIAQLTELTRLATAARDACQAALVRAVSTLPALECLTTGTPASVVHTVTAMSEALPRMQALRALSFDFCGALVSPALAALTALTQLSVHWNDYKCSDVTPLAQGLASMPALRSLHVSSTSGFAAGEMRGAAVLMGALSRMQQLTSLSLQLGRVPKAGELAAGLTRAMRLRSLCVHVSCREENDCGCTALTVALQSLTRLTHLDLFLQGYDAVCGDLAAAWLQPMSRPERLKLDVEGWAMHTVVLWEALGKLQALTSVAVMFAIQSEDLPHDEGSFEAEFSSPAWPFDEDVGEAVALRAMQRVVEAREGRVKYDWRRLYD